MKKALVITAAVLLAMGVIFYFSIANRERLSHMHFSTQGGVLKNVVYYSQTPPETAAAHNCDGKFADMREDLYEVHLRLWQEKYGRGGAPGR